MIFGAIGVDHPTSLAIRSANVWFFLGIDLARHQPRVAEQRLDGLETVSLADLGRERVSEL